MGNFFTQSQEVILVNTSLEVAPETVNKSPYGEGWMIRIQTDNPADPNGLMSSSEYEVFTDSLI